MINSTNQEKTTIKSPIPYFKHKELACPQTNQLILADGFAAKLLQLRIAFNQSMIITSCCRSKAYNREVGGHPRSLHVYDKPYHNTDGTCAIDIAVTNTTTKAQLMQLAWNLGWSIGINEKFLHLDRRTDHTNLKQMVFRY
ncbi:MAG: hypothetical protein COA94_08490 [Rickettsiales bacterium]|nr:MAG: hypothetical protein COA94_08490 [Rickettsiales bacterium]